ncbi:hypothetical protein AB595_14625 [Massilia sp. WF1]|nr:hypothetical protein AB595_14625 [Massilia sp. WF1]
MHGYDFGCSQQRALELLFTYLIYNVANELLTKLVVHENFINHVGAGKVLRDGRVSYVFCQLHHLISNTVYIYSISNT